MDNKMIGWKKKVIMKNRYGERVEYSKGKYVIDILYNDKNQQGFPGSNMVNILVSNYGGWLLGTPKMFKTIKDTNVFVKKAMKKLDNNELGKKVSFPK